MAVAKRYSIIERLTPRFLLPDFTWPQRRSNVIATQISTPPKPSHPFVSQFWGWAHRRLLKFSYYYYCRWVGAQFDNQIVPLPFGLLLKWSDGTRFEEVQAMSVARAAGIPVPKVICYGEHPDSPHAPVSILMTRIPGSELGVVYDTMLEDEKKQIMSELKLYLNRMRMWSNPWGCNRICSISGGPIRSVRVPQHLIGPYDIQDDFNKRLIAPSWEAKDRPTYEHNIDLVKKLHGKSFRIMFTHGDLMHHNILVKNGHVTGFIDWEASGWYPEYWEFTTAWRYQKPEFWWWHFVHDLGGAEYLEEMESDRALINLTSGSFAY